MTMTNNSKTLMAPYSKEFIVMLYLLVFPFLCALRNADASDLCLSSFKESLQDPLNNLQSWVFSNNSSQGLSCQFSGVHCDSDHNKVMRIEIGNMGLKGMFPPALTHCLNLEVLDLSGNDLSGPIPSDIDARLPSVKKLVLSNNNFSGEIPPSLSGCLSLIELRLDNNKLTGQIPQGLAWLQHIETFTVANNQLSGRVPVFINTRIPLEAYENNRGLCDGPLRPCKEQTLIFTTSFKHGFTIGYLIFTLSTITVFMHYCVPRTQVKEAKDVLIAASLVNNSKNKKKKADEDSQLATVQLIQIPTLERMVPSMSFAQLSKATDDFREGNIIGFGKIGTMYKAVLPTGRLIAVKRLHDFQLITEEFVFELKTLGSFKHVNCVPLLGFCIESSARLLVYKYMSNGNLYNWLHPVEEGAKILEWPLRVKIAVGLARGLAWLHHICSFRVVHLNISSKSVLLDQNFEPKLSNFGKAMLMNPNDIGLNRPRGFSINSEFWELDFMKKDVLDFGIVFLELIGGEDLSSKTKSKERFGGNVLEKWKYQLSTNKSQIQQGLDCEMLENLLGLAFNCIQPFPERRPTMLEVYRTLRVVGEKYGVVEVFEIE